jgi:hypothetical protein
LVPRNMPWQMYMRAWQEGSERLERFAVSERADFFFFFFFSVDAWDWYWHSDLSFVSSQKTQIRGGSLGELVLLDRHRQHSRMTQDRRIGAMRAGSFGGVLSPVRLPAIHTYYFRTSYSTQAGMVASVGAEIAQWYPVC